MLSSRCHSRQTSKCSHMLSMLVAVIISIWSMAVQSSSQTPDVETILRQRMTAYWDAMQKGDYEAASDYIHPDSRKLFIFRVPKATILRWKIDKLAFNADKTVCDTVVAVGRPLPFLFEGQEIPDFPLENQWVLAPDGAWYLKLPWKADENPMLQLYKGVEDANGKMATTNSAIPQLEPPKTAVEPAMVASERLVSDPRNPEELHMGEKGTFRFNYLNSGTAPIKITYAYSDCHCTGIAQNYPTIEPGQKGTLEITVDTFGLPLGPVTKQVMVGFSDLPKPVPLNLVIQTVPNFTVTPLAVDFSEIQIGAHVEKTVHIKNVSGRTVKFLPPFKSEPQVTVSLDKTDVAPNEVLTITFRCDAVVAGEFADLPMLRTDLAAEPMINIPLRGKIIS